MKKRWITIILTGLLLFISTPVFAATFVIVDDKQVGFYVQPILQNDHLMIQAQPLFDAIGAFSNWKEDTNTFMIFLPGKTISFLVGSKETNINGATILMDEPATPINDRIMIPISFIEQNIDCIVTWDKNLNIITVQGKVIDVNKTDSNGWSYVGKEKYGQNDGYGVFAAPGILTYKGEWKANLRNGYGIQIEADGTQYEGEWKDNLRCGRGTMIYQAGDKYEGEWANGLPNGQGTFYWLSGYFNGDKYVGQFVNGFRNGQGTYYWHTGSSWTGPWVNDKPDGVGTLQTPSGTSFSVRYINGQLMTNGSQNTSSSAANVLTTGVVESRIDGTFEGWDGDTIFKLQNGQIWQQSVYSYTYHYAYSPQVTIYPYAGGYKMHVEGVDKDIYVVRLR